MAGYAAAYWGMCSLAKGHTLWTAATVVGNWAAVCWAPGNAGTGGAIANPGLFVAVGNASVMTSPDGLTWTGRTAAEANNWTSICWAPGANSGNGFFVAVASNGTHRVMTSPDGVNWTARTASAARPWNSVAWSQSLFRFVACGTVISGSGTSLMYSNDGITWTACTVTYSDNYKAVCWSPDLAKFCAVVDGSSAYQSVLSTDGITFSSSSLQYGYMDSICWSPSLGLFVCAHYDPSYGEIYYSTSGAVNTWTGISATPPSYPSYLASIAWSPDLGLLCVVGYGAAATSTNGTSWTKETSAVPATTLFNGVCWSHELNIYCAVGNQKVMIREQ